MDWLMIVLQAISDYLVVPIIAALCGAVIFILKTRVDKITKSIIAKNEVEKMNKSNTTRNEVLKMIDSTVEAAVVSNMQLANEMKAQSEDGKLSEEQIEKLDNMAHEMVYNTLPTELTTADGALMEIVGGQERLDSIIRNAQEKYVFIYKSKKKDVKDLSDDSIPEAMKIFLSK